MLADPVEDGVAVIGTISKHRLNGDHPDRAEQGDGLGRVAGPARREGEAGAGRRGRPLLRAACWNSHPATVQDTGPLHFFAPAALL